MLSVEISPLLNHIQAFSPHNQQRSKQRILVKDIRTEPQIPQYFPLKDIHARSRPQIVMYQEFRPIPSPRQAVSADPFPVCGRKAEHQHVHPLLPDKSDNPGIAGRKKPVVTVDKLYILTTRLLNSTVTGHRRTLVLHIMLHQYLILIRQQIQRLDAGDTLIQHPLGLVVIRNNERYQHRHFLTQNLNTLTPAHNILRTGLPR